MEYIYDLKGCKRVWKEIPHLAPEVITFLKNYLTKKMTVFEWGSGGSTLWIAKRVKKIYSIEVSYVWYQFLTEKIKEERLKNVTLHYYPIDPYIGYVDNIYFETINNLKRKFPLIIVDGAVATRNSCFERAVKHLTEYGYIIFDDFQHTAFSPSREFLIENNWKVNYYEKTTTDEKGKVKGYYNLTGLIRRYEDSSLYGNMR